MPEKPHPPKTPVPPAPPLLTAKYSLPPVRAQWVRRPRLLRRLALNPETALALVAAPAGFGKTTLLVDWCSSLRQSGLAVGWVSLEESDNDPVRFFRYLAAALGRALDSPAGLRAALETVESAGAPGLEAGLTLLLNALGQSGRACLLALDDYHRIHAPAVHSAVSYLVEHLPGGVHLALGSRAVPPLPLSRWQAGGRMIALTAADLRFNPEEAAEFFSKSGLDASPEQIDPLVARSEGWAAGLQLARLALEHTPGSLEDFLASFSGQHRPVAGYLMDEVFSHQPPGRQTFLLRTCLLERLNAGVCAAVLGDRSPLECQEALEGLERENLFTLPLDDRGQWFRYHRLFAEMLRARLERVHPEWIPDIHQRASIWLEEQQDWPEAAGQAVEHALAAGDPARAARLLEGAAAGFLARSEHETLTRWLEAIPSEELDAHPQLLTAWTWVLTMRGELEALEPLLQRVETILQQSSHPTTQTLRGQASAIRAFLSLTQGDPQSMVELAQAALRYLPPGDLFWRGIAVRVLGEGYIWPGDLDAAASAIGESSAISIQAGYLSLGLSALAQLAMLHSAQGRLNQAARLLRRALDQAGREGWQDHPYTGMLHAGLANVLLEWNEIEAAEDHLDRALDLGREGGAPGIIFSAQGSRIRLRLAQDNPQGALELLTELQAQAAELPAPGDPSLTDALKARIYLAAGELDRAMAWAQACKLDPRGPIVPGSEAGFLSLALVWLACGRLQPDGPWLDQAAGLLERLVESAQARRIASTQIEAMLPLGLARHARGDTRQAVWWLEKTLALTISEGYLRIYLEQGPAMLELLQSCRDQVDPALRGEVERILRAAGKGGMPAGPEAQDQALTGRELEVLRLAAQGASNREIAEQLIVSLATVKSHIHHIMTKLSAQNRTEAAARARQMGLL